MVADLQRVKRAAVLMRLLAAPKPVEMAASEDGHAFYFPCGNNLKVYETHTGSHQSTLKGHYESINCTASNPISSEVYTGSNDRQILVWEPPPLSHYSDTQDEGNEVGGRVEGRIDDGDAWSDSD